MMSGYTKEKKAEFGGVSRSEGSSFYQVKGWLCYIKEETDKGGLRKGGVL